MKELFNLNLVFVKVMALLTGLTSGETAQDARDRGDVPGWVMITMMTVATLPLTPIDSHFPVKWACR